MQEKESLLGDIQQVLGWNTSPEHCLTAMNACHRQFVAGRLLTVARNQHSDLLDIISELTLPRQLRLVLAPELFRLVFRNDYASIETFIAIEKYVAIEHAMASGREHSITGWTALGDMLFGRNGVQDGDVSNLSQDTKASILHRAPRLRGIVLDSASPYAAGIFPARFGPVRMYDGPEVRDLAARVEPALEFIGSRSGHALKIVESSIRVLALARVDRLRAMTLSTSRHESIGLTGLSNLESPGWSRARIADALIHEAIHSMLYKAELYFPLFQDYEVAYRLQARSPWSGRLLFLPAFVHACFVWFGLAMFWGRSEILNTDDLFFRERAVAGFQGCNPVESLSADAQACIQPSVRQTILRMTEEVLGSEEVSQRSRRP